MGRSTWLVLALASAGPALAASPSLPQRVGDCTRTSVARVGTRLQDGSTGQDIPGSGAAVSFRNGAYQVSYEEDEAVAASHPGDPVLMCLVKLPDHCPPGDERGRVYTTTNLRTLRSWTLPDAEHTCGGA